ncbi:retropepsin-like aspartic protease [Hanstruepera flava]|uniref:retropepsin-like aspartic protease n=1 Tax=Hanstruepera flava TaxID=2930218 RepID=UPI0020295E5F|nr:retropepsin-like aspartic protease [Hanstruepera flava]
MPRILLFLLIVCFSSVLNANDIIKKGTIIFPKSEKINEYTTRIPFKLVDHLIIVEAEIYNKKGNFIIDTGSESMILNKMHFNNLYKHHEKKNQSFGVMEAIDNPYEKHVKDFVLQNFKLETLKSDVINLSHIEQSKKIKLLGIIGYSVLKDYEVFVDLHLNQITLSKVDRFGNKLDKNVYLEKIVDSLNFTLKNHTIILFGDINNKKVKFGLDTAAEFNQISKNLNKDLLNCFIPKKRLVLMDASNKKTEVIAGKLHRVRLSKTIYFGPMDTVLTNLKRVNEAFGTDLDGILGYEFFKYKRTIINYQKEKLYFINYPIKRH